ncbi:Vitamin B12 import ATP-binding protein BtuD [Streptomyces alboniger]
MKERLSRSPRCSPVHSGNAVPSRTVPSASTIPGVPTPTARREPELFRAFFECGQPFRGGRPEEPVREHGAQLAQADHESVERDERDRHQQRERPVRSASLRTGNSGTLPYASSASVYDSAGSQTVATPTTPPSTMRASSHSTVRSRSRQVADGCTEISVPCSPGVSSNRACTPSPRRTAGIRPTGISTSAGTHGKDISTHSHTLTISIGTHRCRKRVYVVPRRSGRRKRAIGSSWQPALTVGLPRTGERISTHGGGPDPPSTARLADMTSIDVQALTKEYGTRRAVDALTFRVLPGRVTGFLGPNGAGKSTTMRLVLGLDRPTSGTATIGGRPYATLDEPLRHVGALLDAEAAHGSRTGRDHLRVLAASNRVAVTRVDEVLAETGLTSVAHRRVRTYSLGMRQRLGIAAALLGDPEVVMLDEPSNGLDPEGIIWIRELLRRLAAEGRTVLVSSHLMNETASFADHLVVLGRGRLLADTPMREFIHARVRPRVRIRTTDGTALTSVLTAHGHDAVRHEDGHWTVPEARVDDIGRLVSAAGVPILELASEEATLEQAYLDLTATSAEFTALHQEA